MDRSGSRPCDWDAPVRSWLASLRLSTEDDEDRWIPPPTPPVVPISDELLRSIGQRLLLDQDMSGFLPACCSCFQTDQPDQECPLVVKQSNESLPPASVEPAPSGGGGSSTAKSLRPPPLVFALSRISEGSSESTCSPLHFARLSTLVSPTYEFVVPTAVLLQRRRSFDPLPVPLTFCPRRSSWPAAFGAGLEESSKALVGVQRGELPPPERSLRACAYVTETCEWNDAALVWPSLDLAKVYAAHCPSTRRLIIFLFFFSSGHAVVHVARQRGPDLFLRGGQPRIFVGVARDPARAQSGNGSGAF